MVLLSLVGDSDSSILPLFFHYAESLRFHILLYDSKKEEKNRMQRLEKGMYRFCGHYGYSPRLISVAYDEDSRRSIESTFDSVLSHLKDGELFVNTTEGLSTTAALLHHFAQTHNGTVLAYDRHENSCNFLKNGRLWSEAVSPMTVEEHLMLKNIGYEAMLDDKELAGRKEAVMELMKNTESFLQFKLEFTQDSRQLHLHADKLQALEEIGKDDDRFFIEGGIFEEYCYHLLNELPFDDVRIGIKTEFYSTSKETYKNEFDVLCIKDNHLHIVECKFRKNVHGESLVYKYDSLKDLLDEDGKVVIAAVGGDNITRKKSGKKRVQFYDSTKRRAIDNDILVYQERRFDSKRFQKEVRRFLIDKLPAAL